MKLSIALSIGLFCAALDLHSAVPLNSSATDVFVEALRVTVTSALFNEQVVAAGYAYDTQLREAREQGNCLLWLSVEVKNEKLLAEHSVSPSAFRLICFDKVSHQYESSKRQISANIKRGEIAKGGIMFVLPTNSHPCFLRYNPNLTLDSLRFGAVNAEVTVAVPLRWTGTEFVADSEFWMVKFEETNPELDRLFKRPSATATRSYSTDQRRRDEQQKKKLEADKRVLAWQHQQASNGVAYSQFDLGMRYFKGDGVETNKPLGLFWIRKSAAQDYGEAKEFLKRAP